MKKLYALAGLILICCAAGFGQTPRKAPINPEYLRYLELVEKGLWDRTTKEGYTLGYIPSPIEFITADTGQKEIKDLPSSFDLRNQHGQNYLTEVKHQGSCGSCWAFSTLAAIESRLLIQGEGHYNLSENHMKQHHGFAHGPCDGGNHYLSTAYLSRGSGSILESDAPYHDYDHCSHNGNPPVMYHTQAVFLPDNDNIIKQAIMDYGALYTVMRYEGDYYNASNYTYYYSGSDDPNHAVNLVGWDDNKQTAGGHGAWIVRNSWGTNWGESGYFYIAYQDARVNASVAYWPEKMDFSSNTVINYSDHLGATSGIGYGTNTGYALIKLIADKDHELLNLGTYVAASGATVGFEVYGHFGNGSVSNLLGSIPNHHIDHAGYVTLELPSPIDVSAGQAFYVKVYYRTSGYNWPIPVEKEWSDYSYPTIDQGVSWVSSNGTSWMPIGLGTDWPVNLCVKTHGLAPEDDDPGLSIITFNVRDQHAQAVADATITITMDGSKTISAMPHTENAQASPQAVVQAAPQNGPQDAHKVPRLQRAGRMEVAALDAARPNQTSNTPKTQDLAVLLPGNWAQADAVGTYRWVDTDDHPIGWIFGNNTMGDTGTGMHFQVEETHDIAGAYYWISRAASGSGHVHFRVYDFDGEPGGVLASQTVALDDVVAFPTEEGVTPDQFLESFYVAFDTPVRVHGDFFVGVDFSNLSWNAHGDGIGMASTLAGQGGGGMERAWIKDSDGDWLKAVSAHESLDLDIGVFPVIAETEPIILHTNAGGQASFQASDGHYIYTVEKSGHHPAGGDFAVSGNDIHMDVTLEQILEYTLTYHAGDHGHISGETTQTVPHGGSGSQVEAVPDEGYHFVEWSDGVQTARRTDTNVTANVSVTASFAINEYTLTYHAGDNGHISGETTQTVPHGGSGSQVEAVPDDGYHFVEWSCGLQTAQRTDTEVTDDITVTASFAINKYIIEASANNEQLGSVSGGGEYEHGATATLLATSLDASNYLFVNWTEEGAQVHAAAEYVFEVTSNRSLVAHFQNVTAIQAPEGVPAIRVFPIPARHILVVESAVPMEEVRLFDMVGRRHYAASIQALFYEINVADLEAGFYFLQLTTEIGLSTFQVFVAD